MAPAAKIMFIKKDRIKKFMTNTKNDKSITGDEQ
jgi:hypothetical protein